MAAADWQGNDAARNGNPLTVTLLDDVQHGSLTIHADQSFTYTPGSGFTGADQFTYTVNNGSDDSNEAYAALGSAKVAACRTIPTASVGDSNADRVRRHDVPGVLEGPCKRGLQFTREAGECGVSKFRPLLIPWSFWCRTLDASERRSTSRIGSYCFWPVVKLQLRCQSFSLSFAVKVTR